MALSYKNDEEQDARLNPNDQARDLYRQEHEAIPDYDRSKDGLDDYPVSGGVADGKNPSANIDDAKSKEEASNEFGYGRNKSEQKETVNLRAIVKKKGPLVGIVVALLGAGGILTTLLSPALLVVQISEMMTERYNDQLAALDLRSTALLKKKLGKTTTKGVCGTKLTIRCKYQTFGQRQLNRLKKAGITPIPEEKNPLGRYKPTHFEFEGKRIAAGNLLSEARKNPGLRSALRHGYNPKFAGFSDRIATKLRTKVGIKKASAVKPGSEEDMKKQLQETAAEGDLADLETKKLTQLKDEEGNPVRGPDGEPLWKDENGNVYSNEEATRINNTIDEINARQDLEDAVKRAGLKSSIKGALLSTSFGVGALDSLCTAWRLVRVAGFAAKIYQQRQLIRYAYEFMKFGSKVKASAVSKTAEQPTPEEAAFFGDILTNPNSEGKTATDSHGYKFAAYGDAFHPKPLDRAMNAAEKSEEEQAAATDDIAIQNETARYVNGQLIPDNTMTDIVGYIQKLHGKGGNTVDAADSTCNFIKSWQGQALVIGAAALGLVVGFFTGGVSVGIGTAIQVAASVAISVALALLTPKLLEMARGEVITGDENGNEAGNAIASGAGGINEQMSRTRGLAPMKKDDFAKYDDITTEVVADYAEVERYERGPFDATSRHTFLGSIVSSLLPHLSNSKTTGASLLGFSSLVSSSLSSIVSPKSSALQSSKEMYDQCDDPEYDKWNLAADPFCNARGGITPSTLSIDPYTVAEFMEKKDSEGNFIYIESDEVEEGEQPVPKGAYKEYIAKCFDRQSSFGDSVSDYVEGTDTGSNQDDGKECVDGQGGKNEYRNDIFRLFYVDTGIQDGMDSDFEVGGEGSEETTGGSEFKIMTYNIKTSDQTDDLSPPQGDRYKKDEERYADAAKIMKDSGASVFALQELDNPARPLIEKNLGSNYASTRSTSNHSNITPVYWKTDKFTKSDEGVIAYPWSICPGLQKCTDASWVKLKDVNTDQEFYVVSIHMTNLRRGAGGNGDGADQREASANILNDFAKDKDVPVFVGGDFNSSWKLSKDDGSLNGNRSRIPYCVMTENIYDNAYDLSANNSGKKCPTTDKAYQIDHIYASRGANVAVKNYKRIIDDLTLITSDHPNHKPVVADITIPGTGGANTGAGTEFTIATYNAPVRGNWGVAANAITSHNFEIVGMQEIGGGNYQFLRKNLGQSGFGVYPDWNKPKYSDFCSNARPIFYSKDRFKLVKGEFYDYAGGKYRGGSIPAANCDDGEKHETDRINAPIVWLEDKDTGQLIIAMNIHNVAGGNYALKRYQSAKIHVNQVERLMKENPGVPIFFTGDFNEGTAVRLRGMGANTTFNGDYRNLLYCMFAENKLMQAAGKPNTCPDNPPRRTPVDFIYHTPGVKVEWLKEFIDPSTNDGPHPVHYARMVVPGTGGSEGGPGWTWPIKPAESKPGPCFKPGSHAGVDINSNSNSTVVAMHSGKVVEVGLNAGAAGNYVMIKSSTGVYYAYQHLLSGSIQVNKGQEVGKGKVVAKMGLTGDVYVSSSKAHLHVTTSRQQTLGSRSNTSAMIDPMTFLKNAKPNNYNCY